MKKFLAFALAATMTAGLLTGCASSGDGADGKADGALTAAVCIPMGSDEYFVTLGDQIKAGLEAEGATVQIADAGNNVQTGLKQVENFTTQKVDFMYVLPAGDGPVYADYVQAATDAGILTLVSHTYTGEGTATVFVGCDEFYMGCMAAPMVSRWLDSAYPDAGPGEVKVLAMEMSSIPDMIYRCAGMKIIAEKYLRQIDVDTAGYIHTEGDPVTYLDESGKEVQVEEPTGGLILDENGHAQLNPFYDERVELVEYSNRNISTNMDAQKALDVIFTENGGENTDIKAIMCYGGDAASGASEKLMAAHDAGTIKTDLSGLAVFGADITDTNIERMTSALENKSLVRGVVTSGDIGATCVEIAPKMLAGEELEPEIWEYVGYMMYDEDGKELVEVKYNDELPASSEFKGE